MFVFRCFSVINKIYVNEKYQKKKEWKSHHKTLFHRMLIKFSVSVTEMIMNFWIFNYNSFPNTNVVGNTLFFVRDFRKKEDRQSDSGHILFSLLGITRYLPTQSQMEAKLNKYINVIFGEFLDNLFTFTDTHRWELNTYK